jgi:site-specific recombinase XerD
VVISPCARRGIRRDTTDWLREISKEETSDTAWKEPFPMSSKTQQKLWPRPAKTIPELEQSKSVVLSTLASEHSRRSYKHAIDRFISWYCSEPRLTFNRSILVSYRSSLEHLGLSAATINLHLSAIRRLADESAESGWLSPELAIGIRRVKGVKRLGRKVGNWLSANQAQDLVNAASKNDLQGCRDGAILGLLLGCGLRRSEVVGLKLDQLQMRDGRWIIANLVGKGGRIRTVPMPSWCKDLVDTWLRRSGVSDGRIFRRILKGGIVKGTGVTANVVWFTVKRCAGHAGIANLAPHDLRRTCARLCHGCGGELEQIQFLLGHASVQTTERYIGSKQRLQDAVNDRLGISVVTAPVWKPSGAADRIAGPEPEVFGVYRKSAYLAEMGRD